MNEPGQPTPPPPLEANDQLVTGSVTAGWAVALIVLLIVRSSLPADARWWIWTCVAGVVMGLFALWYVPRLKRGRSRAAARRAARDWRRRNREHDPQNVGDATKGWHPLEPQEHG